MIRDIDPLSWFGTREIKGTIPKHFVKSNTLLHEESYLWVVKKLAGRFGTSLDLSDISTIDCNTYVFFEDPKEATIYELRWSGGN